MSRKYKFHNPTAAYFVSFAVVYWLDVFTRQAYFTILEQAVEYCRKEKGMEVFAYCFMPSHVHLVFKSNNEDPSGLLRDFKGFTAKKTIKAIEENPQESRKEWLLWMMESAGKKKSNVSKRQFWQQHNKPIELWSGKVIKQKIDYIHNNPVEQGFVTNPIDWKYSSARNYADDETVLKIDNKNMHLGMMEQ
ncbi:transposase [Oceanihabitans sp. IOP_32]|uniref:REP-associated tyrosine transposase n=1 Tax=Oceanihabitans sp. IOP_32 TaxID=2529032 RepID=UPI001292E478|nr:transposase [Oceanihabitans sp. IOP_32]QFZ53919.1 transposase [Oceanihabitans sp. IOP_32]